MKKRLFKTIFSFFTFIFITYASFANASVKHINVGDTNLVIEPPIGMCFLDKGSPTTVEMYNDITKRLSDTSQKQILVIFAPCETIVTSAEGANSNKILENFGYISWLYPSMEHKYPEGRKSFILDLQKRFKKNNRGGFVNLDNAIATLLRESQKIDEKIIEDVSMIAYTTIRNVPLEIKMKSNLAYFENAEQSYAMLNNFINYQINLNE